ASAPSPHPTSRACPGGRSAASATSTPLGAPLVTWSRLRYRASQCSVSMVFPSRLPAGWCLAGRAAVGVGGVALLAVVNLRVGSVDEVAAEDGGEPDEVDGDVADLRADPGSGFRVVGHDCRRLLGSEPLELGDELADLPGERHGQVLRRVELAPVTGVGELLEPQGKAVKLRH